MVVGYYSLFVGVANGCSKVEQPNFEPIQRRNLGGGEFGDKFRWYKSMPKVSGMKYSYALTVWASVITFCLKKKTSNINVPFKRVRMLNPHKKLVGQISIVGRIGGSGGEPSPRLVRQVWEQSDHTK